jgi:hypothetical protein
LRNRPGGNGSTATMEKGRAKPMRPRSPIDLSLQANAAPTAMPTRRRHRPRVAVIGAGIFLGAGILSMGMWPTIEAPRITVEAPARVITRIALGKQPPIGPIGQVAWTAVAETAVAQLPVVGW